MTMLEAAGVAVFAAAAAVLAAWSSSRPAGC